MTEWLHFHFSLSCIGEGNGNPLQCSCLENTRDGGTWWAAVYEVAQSWTRLKRLSSSNNVDETTLMAVSEQELKTLLMKVKKESEKVCLKLNIQKPKSWHLSYHIMANRWGKCGHEIKRCLLLGRKAMSNIDSILEKKQRHHFAEKGLPSQSCGFSISHVWIWELYHKVGWMPKNWHFWTVVLENTLESPLEIKPVSSKGNQS